MSATWWQQLVLVAAGGALGSVGRFLLSAWMARSLGTAFPWGTLAVNLLGSLLAGLLLAWLEGRGASAPLWRAFVLVGVLGGLTSFSSLVLEFWLLHRVGAPGWAASYLLASLVGGIGLLWLGLQAAACIRG